MRSARRASDVRYCISWMAKVRKRDKAVLFTAQKRHRSCLGLLKWGGCKNLVEEPPAVLPWRCQGQRFPALLPAEVSSAVPAAAGARIASRAAGGDRDGSAWSIAGGGLGGEALRLFCFWPGSPREGAGCRVRPLWTGMLLAVAEELRYLLAPLCDKWHFGGQRDTEAGRTDPCGTSPTELRVLSGSISVQQAQITQTLATSLCQQGEVIPLHDFTK